MPIDPLRCANVKIQTRGLFSLGVIPLITANNLQDLYNPLPSAKAKVQTRYFSGAWGQNLLEMHLNPQDLYNPLPSAKATVRKGRGARSKRPKGDQAPRKRGLQHLSFSLQWRPPVRKRDSKSWQIGWWIELLSCS